MFALLRVVEVRVLHQQLPHAVFLMDKLPVVLHQDALPLCGIIRLYLVVAAAEFAPGTLQVVQPPDFRRAGRDPNHTGLEFRAQPGKDVVVNILVLFANQRHRADFADKVKLVVHHRCFFPPKLWVISAASARCRHPHR